MTIFRVRCIALLCATVFSVSLIILLDFSWPALLVLGLVSFSVFLTLLAIEKNARQIRLLIRNQRDLIAIVKEVTVGVKDSETQIRQMSRKLDQDNISRDKTSLENKNNLGNVIANINKINSRENKTVSSLNVITSELHKNEMRTRQIAAFVKDFQPKESETKIIQQQLDDLAQNKDLKDLTELVQNIKTEQRANQLRLRQIGQLTRSVELLLTEEGKNSGDKDSINMLENSRREITFRVLDDLSQIRYILESNSNDSAANNDQH